MVNNFTRIKYIHLFLFILMINKTFYLQVYETFNLEIEQNPEEEEEDNNDLNILHYNNLDDNHCKKWIPSLIMPILMGYKEINVTGEETRDIQTNYPVVSIDNKNFTITLFNHTFLNKYKTIMGKIKNSNIIKKCYIGFSHKNNSFSSIDNSQILLNSLKANGYIKKNIFSFDKWFINPQSIKSAIYIGDSHEDYTIEDKNLIKGTCSQNKENLYWGCLFNGMIINKNFIDFKKDEKEYYKTYFSSENYKIIFPQTFKNKFDNITKNTCKSKDKIISESDKYLSCTEFFKEKDYEEIQLIGQKMNITIEIDNKQRFYIKNEENKYQTRILYEDIDYFIFPLIMFKKFHIQFDAENNLINFFTNDSSILQVEKSNKESPKGSSKGLTVFLIIFIILLVVGLLYGIFWLIKRKRAPLEKNINKYNKFDEDENFQNMNEKVF